MAQQTILTAANNYESFDRWLRDNHIRTLLLVCDDSMQFLKIKDYFETLQSRIGVRVVKFDRFRPNPLYESVADGVSVFNTNGCEAIAAIGGGSAIDVAKCIKLYCNMDSGRNYLEQTVVPNDVPLLAMPTTAGTGSEATRYAVIYYNGVKQSVTHESCIPSAVMFDAIALQTLPPYQKKSTMLDALCHALESFWSVNSTDESKGYSRKAIELILASQKAYLSGDAAACEDMLHAANLAGKAINITQTTAGHAMCYKLTSLFGIAHGHAAALCDRTLFPWMLRHTDKCIDTRGEDYLCRTFGEIASAFKCDTPEEASRKFRDLVDSLELSVPVASESDYEILKNSVNPTRLNNHPIALDVETIDQLYREILGENL